LRDLLAQRICKLVLRPSRIDGASHAASVIKLIAQRLRQVWREMRLIVRGDGGFCVVKYPG
jgi:hypothetical protein